MLGLVLSGRDLRSGRTERSRPLFMIPVLNEICTGGGHGHLTTSCRLRLTASREFGVSASDGEDGGGKRTSKP